MAVLYRKYRPQTFAEVLNQKHIVQTLQSQVESGQIAHAYLFTGGRGLGKTSIARIFAKAVNCPKATGGDACGQCDVCRQVAANSFLDLVEIDAASNTGVDNIRDLIEHVKFSPSIGKYKVFIIDEVHMLSKGAFNALLKTLEEPPAHAIFILATTEAGKVPATIASRAQRFDFRRFTIQDLKLQLQMVAKVEKIKISEEILDLIAQRAEGGARDALSLLDKVFSLGSNPTLADCQQLLGVTDVAYCEELVGLMGEGNTAAIPEFFAKLSEHGVDATLFNRDLLEYLRKMLVQKISPQSVKDETPNELMGGLARKFDLNRLVYTIRLFLKSLKDIPSVPSPEIPLLLAAVEGCRKQVAPEAGSRPGAGQRQNNAAPAPMVSVERDQNPQVQSATDRSADVVVELYDETVSQDEVERAWQDVIGRLKERNGPLANLVKNSPLQGIREGRIVLGVKYLFHKQNLENAKNLNLICGVLEEILKKKVGVVAELLPAKVEVKTNDGAELADALKVFGGELIEE